MQMYTNIFIVIFIQWLNKAVDFGRMLSSLFLIINQKEETENKQTQTHKVRVEDDQ